MTNREWLTYFSINLMEMLEEARMTQRELADKAGISEASLCKYVQGHQMPGVRALVNIADALNCSVDHLVDFGDRIK